MERAKPANSASEPTSVELHPVRRRHGVYPVNLVRPRTRQCEVQTTRNPNLSASRQTVAVIKDACGVTKRFVSGCQLLDDREELMGRFRFWLLRKALAFWRRGSLCATMRYRSSAATHAPPWDNSIVPIGLQDSRIASQATEQPGCDPRGTRCEWETEFLFLPV